MSVLGVQAPGSRWKELGIHSSLGLSPGPSTVMLRPPPWAGSSHPAPAENMGKADLLGGSVSDQENS